MITQEQGIKKVILAWVNKIGPGKRIAMFTPGAKTGSLYFDKIDMVNAIYKIRTTKPK